MIGILKVRQVEHPAIGVFQAADHPTFRNYRMNPVGALEKALIGSLARSNREEVKNSSGAVRGHTLNLEARVKICRNRISEGRRQGEIEFRLEKG